MLLTWMLLWSDLFLLAGWFQDHPTPTRLTRACACAFTSLGWLVLLFWWSSVL